MYLFLMTELYFLNAVFVTFCLSPSHRMKEPPEIHVIPIANGEMQILKLHRIFKLDPSVHVRGSFWIEGVFRHVIKIVIGDLPI